MISHRKSIYTAVFILIFVFTLASIATGQIIRTTSEDSSFAIYTSHEEMIEFLEKIQKTTTEMTLSEFGTTLEGRVQPYAIFSRPLVTKPWEAMTSGKPIVVLAANIHGGERTVRESLLLLVRELATKGTEMNNLLDKLVVLIVPSINPDGFAHGTRGNSTGQDMNRDWVKLEQPALQNYIQNIIHTWHPHVFLDAHNGGSRPYNICYQGPGNAAGDQRLTDLCDQELFPFIDQEMLKNGYKSWYYSGGDSTRWTTAPTFIRGSIGYGGITNSIAILFESPGQDRETGARSGLVASEAILKYVTNNAEKVMMTVDRARRETIEMGQNATGDIVVQMKKGPKPYKVSYEIIPRRPRGAGAGRGAGGGGGGAAQQQQQPVLITGADLINEPIPIKTRPRPYAYILEPRARKAVDMLKRHKIRIEILQEETEISIEAYDMIRLDRASVHDHPAAADSVIVAEEMVKETRTFPKGTFIIRTGQVLGRLASHLLEPESGENVITWNTMDSILPRIRSAGRGRAGIPPTAGGQRAGAGQTQTQPERRPAIIPIFKLMIPTPLPTKILEY
ncbi:M14 family zinc carboxypeptidase [candidate division KSB1 bacterium]